MGFLSWQSFSGYDLKKMFSDSTALYWSGNNNQIYTTLVQLREEGLVEQEVQYQASLPAKKNYSLTEKGRDELRKWLVSTPELPEFRNSFLIQLAWADQLEEYELETLIKNYEEEVQAQLFIQQEKIRRGQKVPNRTPREAYLWKMISENIISSYKNELIWINKLRNGLFSHSDDSEEGEK